MLTIVRVLNTNKDKVVSKALITIALLVHSIGTYSTHSSVSIVDIVYMACVEVAYMAVATKFYHVFLGLGCYYTNDLSKVHSNIDRAR